MDNNIYLFLVKIIVFSIDFRFVDGSSKILQQQIKEKPIVFAQKLHKEEIVF